MWRKCVVPSRRVILEVDDQVTDLGNDIVLELCKRMEEVSVLEAPS